MNYVTKIITSNQEKIKKTEQDIGKDLAADMYFYKKSFRLSVCISIAILLQLIIMTDF